MRETGVDERITRGWGSGNLGQNPESRYVSREPVASSSSAQDDESAAVASPTQGGYQPDIVLIVKQDGSVLFLNRSDPGSQDGSSVGQSMLDFISAEHRNAVVRSLEKVFFEGKPDSFLCRGETPFVTGAWYHCRVAPNHRDSGVVSATVIARDITQWKRNEDGFRAEIDDLKSQVGALAAERDEVAALLADQEKREKELNRFRRILDQAGEAIFITDPETGRFVDVNETACRWLGHSRERLLKMGVNDLDLDFPLESPDGVPDHVTNTRDANRPSVYNSGSHRRRNGTSFPVEVALSRRRFGDQDFMLVIARDVKKRRMTEQALKESEDKYRSLFELSRDAVYCSARDGSVSEVNDSAIDLFGYTRAEFVGLEARRLYLNAEDIRAFQRKIEDEGAVRELRVKFQTKTGREFEGFLAATLRSDSEGNVQGYQCIISPIQAEGSLPAVSEAADRDVPEVERNSVLVVGKEKWVLDEARTVLERAEVNVLCARTAAAATEVLRSQPDQIGVVVLDFAVSDPALNTLIDEIGQTAAAAQIVVLQEESGIAEATGLGHAVVRKPLHPLALAQQVRESLKVSRLGQGL